MRIVLGCMEPTTAFPPPTVSWFTRLRPGGKDLRFPRSRLWDLFRPKGFRELPRGRDFASSYFPRRLDGSGTKLAKNLVPGRDGGASGSYLS